MSTVAARLPSDTQSTLTFRSRQFVVCALVVTCAPLFLLITNRDWFFTSEIYVDPWHYVGFFHEYLNPQYSPGAYKLARLPWILCGVIANRLLSPIPAAYALHALFLCLTPLSLFVALYALLQRVALAGVVASVFAFYTHAHGSGAWDYHNTAGGALYLVAVALLALPSVASGRRLPVMLAGAVTALALHTNITLVNFVPVLAFVHVRAIRIWTGDWPRVGDVTRRAAWALLGMLLVTVVLGFINWAVGREFVFFGFLTTLVLQYVADPVRYQGGYHQSWSAGWVLTARYLALPAAVFVVGVVFLARRHRATTQPTRGTAILLVGTFLAIALAWIGWQTAGQTALDWNYFAYPLIPPCFLALGGLLSRGWPDVWERHSAIAVAGTAAISAAALIALPNFPRLELLTAPTIALVGCALFAAGLLTYLARPGVATSVVTIAVLAVGNRLVAYQPQDYAADDPCKIQPYTYAAIVDAASWLGDLDPTYKRVRTWFDQNEIIHPKPGCDVAVGNMGYAISSMAFVHYLTPPFPMPSVAAVPDGALHALANDEAILSIITSDAAHLESWDRRLLSIGLERREVAHRAVSLLDSRVTLHAWEVVSREGRPRQGDFESPAITITDRTPLKVNMYGVPRGDISDLGDRVVVTPSDPRDHVEYGLLALPPLSRAAWARVTIESPSESLSSCQVELKDPSFAVLATAPCRSGVHYVTLPARIPALRLYISDLSSRPFVLPKKIEIELATPPK